MIADPGPDDMARFDAALSWLWPIEGGWVSGEEPRDSNPTMYGITQATWTAAGYPGSVRWIHKAQARNIYYNRYWKEAGCLGLRWPLALVHFDAAVNHGPGVAWKLLRQAKANVRTYIARRRLLYAAIIRSDPDMAANRNGWENRMKKLERAAGVTD